MASITCGNCKATHDSVATVKACYGIVPATAVASAVGATAKQVAFATKLCQERPEWASVMNYHADSFHKYTKHMISQVIGDALAQPKELTIISGANDQPVKANPYAKEARKGDVHMVEGNYYRIHISQTTGYPYAVRAYIQGEAQWAEDGSLLEAAAVRWLAANGMLKNLSQATKATSEEAAAFGKLVGRCCFCSHQIDTPESTTAGYGPICAERYSLPWGGTV